MIDLEALHAALVSDRPVAVCPAAKETEEFLRNVYFDTDSILFGWRHRLKDRLYALAEKYSSEGWDSEGAFPVSEYAVEAAKHFIDILPEGIKEPFITAEITGDLAFDWDLGEDMTFAVIVSGEHAVYAGIFGDSSRRGTERIYGELPISIKNILLTYFRK
ncbi:MAG: hypothetical protein HY893_08890 [Deltaproteobacteria bacterium]|nr:hypothetical protein [Deltaproteobacteria bacterium]